MLCFCRENIGNKSLLATNRDAKCPKVRMYTFCDLSASYFYKVYKIEKIIYTAI